jgi:hypothetical protein
MFRSPLEVVGSIPSQTFSSERIWQRRLSRAQDIRAIRPWFLGHQNPDETILAFITFKEWYLISSVWGEQLTACQTFSFECLSSSWGPKLILGQIPASWQLSNIVEHLCVKQYPVLTLWRRLSPFGETQLYTLPSDIQTDLESKPFDQLLNFWWLFYRKTTPSSGEISVHHSEPGVQAVFSTCKIAKFVHNKNVNLTFCDKMAISQER